MASIKQPFLALLCILWVKSSQTKVKSLWTIGTWDNGIIMEWKERGTHIILLISVALHEGDDAVVDEEGQRENTSQLREQQPELYTKPTHR